MTSTPARSILRSRDNSTSRRPSVSFSAVKEVLYVNREEDAETSREVQELRLTPISESDIQNSADRASDEPFSFCLPSIETGPPTWLNTRPSIVNEAVSKLNETTYASNTSVPRATSLIDSTPSFPSQEPLFAAGLARPSETGRTPPRIKRSVMSIAGGPPMPLAFRPSLLHADDEITFLPHMGDDLGVIGEEDEEEDEEEDPGRLRRSLMRQSDLRPSDLRPSDPRPSDPRPSELRPSDARLREGRPSTSEVLSSDCAVEISESAADEPMLDDDDEAEFRLSDFLPPETEAPEEEDTEPGRATPGPPTPPRRTPVSPPKAHRTPPPLLKRSPMKTVRPPSVKAMSAARKQAPSSRPHVKSSPGKPRVCRIPPVAKSTSVHRKPPSVPPPVQPTTSPRTKKRRDVIAEESNSVARMQEGKKRRVSEEENEVQGTPYHSEPRSYPPPELAASYPLDSYPEPIPCSEPLSFSDALTNDPIEEDQASLRSAQWPVVMQMLGVEGVLEDLQSALDELGKVEDQKTQPSDDGTWAVSLKSLFSSGSKVLKELAAQVSYNIACDVMEEKVRRMLHQKLEWLTDFDVTRLLAKLRALVAANSMMGIDEETSVERIQDICRQKADLAETRCNRLWQDEVNKMITVSTIKLTYNFVKEVRDKLASENVQLSERAEEFAQIRKNLQATEDKKRSKEQLLQLWNRSLCMFEEQRSEAQKRIHYARQKSQELLREREKIQHQVAKAAADLAELETRLAFLKRTNEQLDKLKNTAEVTKGWSSTRMAGSKVNEIVMAVDASRHAVNPFLLISTSSRKVVAMKQQVAFDLVKSLSVTSLQTSQWKIHYKATGSGLAVKDIQCADLTCSMSPVVSKPMHTCAMAEIEGTRRLQSVLGHGVKTMLSKYIAAGGTPGTALSALGWVCLGNVETLCRELLDLRREFNLGGGDFVKLAAPPSSDKLSDLSFGVHLWSEKEGSLLMAVRMVLDVDVTNNDKVLLIATVHIDSYRALKTGSLSGSVSRLEVRRLRPGLPAVLKLPASEWQSFIRTRNGGKLGEHLRQVASVEIPKFPA